MLVYPTETITVAMTEITAGEMKTENIETEVETNSEIEPITVATTDAEIIGTKNSNLNSSINTFQMSKML